MRRIVKPGYVDPVEFGGGQTLSFRPPMLFREVTARAFPLKANIARLAEFVDQYLNMDIPDEIVHFTPALPMVYFMALNYGGMSATTVTAQRLGWVSQHEAFFMVPLERWRRIEGKLVFQGWTCATPFIFVDDALSMITGREVFGWPKALAQLEPDRPVWTTHPRGPTRLLTLSSQLFSHVYAGEREPKRTLITIDRDVDSALGDFPVNPRGPWSPATVLSNAYATSISLMQEAADFAANLRLRGYPDNRNVRSLAEMAGESWRLCGQALAGMFPVPLPAPLSGTNARAALAEDLPRYFSSTINLKQFRDPTHAQRACYSALVESAMGVDRLNQFGLLGETELLRADASGGFSISVTRYQAEPILETLGIEVPNLYEDAREGDTVKLRPQFPFWMDMDLYYGAGDVLCSRTPDVLDGKWVEEWSTADRRQVGRRLDRHPRPKARENAYNTALGAATLPVMGPMHFPDLTIQVYPLLADRAILQRLVDWCWGRLFEDGRAPPKLALELMGSYVYLTVSTVGSKFGRMWSETEDIGQWAEREVAFAIPVRWKLDGRLVGAAMIEPLVFADKARAVATYREVNGRNALYATIESPPDAFASPGGPQAPRRLLRVATESFVELGYGQEAKTQTLFEIDERAPLPAGDLQGWRVIADDWGRALADDLQRKTRAQREQAGAIEGVQALALEALARRAPLHRLDLKQYRDAVDFDRACYQAVVQTERRIERVHDLGEIERVPHIALHRRASYPLAETLGLKVKHTSSGKSVVDWLEPVRPFWMRVSLTESLGRVVATVDPHREPETSAQAPRAWVFAPAPPPAATRGPDVAAPPAFFTPGPPVAVNARMVEALRGGDRRDLAGRVRQLSRLMLVKELRALRSAAARLGAPEAGPDPSAADPLDALEARADALRAALPAWEPPPSRVVRVAELERLASYALARERDPAPAPEAAQSLLAVFAEPTRPTDPALRAADARGLYDLYAALVRGGRPPAASPAPVGEAPSDLIALIKRVEAWIVRPQGFAGPWRDLVPEAAARALDRLRLKRFVAEYDFEPARMAELEASFDAAPLRALARVAEAQSFAQAHAHAEAGFDPAATLQVVAEAFAEAVDDWTEPARFLRMTRGEARVAVETLPEVQLVFEAILNDRWGGHGPPPDDVRAHFPASSLGPLGAKAADWGEANGLARIGEREDGVFVVA